MITSIQGFMSDNMSLASIAPLAITDVKPSISMSTQTASKVIEGNRLDDKNIDSGLVSSIGNQDV